MAKTAEDTTAAPRKKGGKLPLVIGLVLMLSLGAGGFYALYAGLILGHHAAEPDHAVDEALPEIAFVPIDPIVVSLAGDQAGKFLHFTGQIEVTKAAAPEVTLILPRVLDVLNGYLRAVEPQELADSTALVRLRAQMLRRVRMVAGEERVRDLLVTEFVIN